jgi:hypothetical protein
MTGIRGKDGLPPGGAGENANATGGDGKCGPPDGDGGAGGDAEAYGGNGALSPNAKGGKGGDASAIGGRGGDGADACFATREQAQASGIHHAGNGGAGGVPHAEGGKGGDGVDGGDGGKSYADYHGGHGGNATHPIDYGKGAGFPAHYDRFLNKGGDGGQGFVGVGGNGGNATTQSVGGKSGDLCGPGPRFTPMPSAVWALCIVPLSLALALRQRRA